MSTSPAPLNRPRDEANELRIPEFFELCPNFVGEGKSEKLGCIASEQIQLATAHDFFQSPSGFILLNDSPHVDAFLQRDRLCKEIDVA
jgi:hypothetical protein